jgi:hypothetical protein
LHDDQIKIDEFSILRDKLSLTVADLLAEPIYSNDSKAMANAKTLFQSCVDESQLELRGVTSLLDTINRELGGWPILENDPPISLSEKMTILDRLIKLRKYGLAQIVEVYVGESPKDPKMNILRVNKFYIFGKKIF